MEKPASQVSVLHQRLPKAHCRYRDVGQGVSMNDLVFGWTDRACPIRLHMSFSNARTFRKIADILASQWAVHGVT
jgi:hypothetical protein